MRAGSPLTELVEFSDGFPDGNIAWELLDGVGALVANGTVTPEALSASAVVTVSGAQNTLPVDVLSEPRELHWSYTVGGIIHEDRHRYRLVAFLPLGVSETGVRHKLGVEEHELPDEAIDLVTAYGRFRDKVGEANLTAADSHAALLAGNAIEALAAFALIPALQISLASKESSGTNQFHRQKIDWALVRSQLESYISEGYRAIDPLMDEAVGFGTIFVAVTRADPVTGGAT